MGKTARGFPVEASGDPAMAFVRPVGGRRGSPMPPRELQGAA
jgi:hypothetical protein